MTTADYLEQLQQDREDLVNNLEAKGITDLSGDETFTELVPEVLNISSGDLDWFAIGYDETPQGVVDGYNYAKNIYDNWVPETDLYNKYWGDTLLSTFPLVDTSIATEMGGMFVYCSALTTVPLIDTSNVTNMTSMFEECRSLKEIPQFNTQNVTGMYAMFSNCANLTTVPVLDTSNVYSMDYMFNGCTNLSDESLNNILQMCINATNYGPTSLDYLGITDATLLAKIPTLSNYQAFLNAGWTIN